MTYLKFSGLIPPQARGKGKEKMKEKKETDVRKARGVWQTSKRHRAMLILTKGSLLSFQACVRTFYETPLQLLEKIKNVFNETKTLLKKDWNIFSKNCNDSFAKCSIQGQH